MLSLLPLLSTLLFLTSAHAAVHVAGYDAPKTKTGSPGYFYERDKVAKTEKDLPVKNPEDVLFYLDLDFSKCYGVKTLGEGKTNPGFGELKTLRFDNYNNGKDYEFHIKGYSQEGCKTGKEPKGGEIHMGDIEPGTRNTPVPLDDRVIFGDRYTGMTGWQHPVASFKVVKGKCSKGGEGELCTHKEDLQSQRKERLRRKRMMVTRTEQVTHFRQSD